MIESSSYEYIKCRQVLYEEDVFMERREAFIRWLRKERNKKTGKLIPEKTIERYARNIHKLSDVMYENGIIDRRLYSMRETEEVTSAIAKIKKEHIYLAMNEQSENSVHKALNYYTKFTEAMNARKMDETKKEE